jgi:hypothetical protein
MGIKSVFRGIRGCYWKKLRNGKIQVAGLHFVEHKRYVPVSIIPVLFSKNSAKINQEPQRLVFFAAQIILVCGVNIDFTSRYSIFTKLTNSVLRSKRYRPHFYNFTEFGDKCKLLFMSAFDIHDVPLLFQPICKGRKSTLVRWFLDCYRIGVTNGL